LSEICKETQPWRLHFRDLCLFRLIACVKITLCRISGR
jgi:hypothetical protein